MQNQGTARYVDRIYRQRHRRHLDRHGQHSRYLAAGASVTVTIDTSGWAINCHGCTPYTLDAIADSTTAVCECNEANNTSTLSYTPPLPDLKVNSITPTCTADGLLRVRVNISNVGCAGSGTFVLALQDDQGHSSTSNQAILAAGASRNVDFSNWVSACSPATVNFTATVDSTNTNCECDADNSLTDVYNNTLPDLVVGAITPSAVLCQRRQHQRLHLRADQQQRQRPGKRRFPHPGQ